MSVVASPRPEDVLAVRSRISWSAIMAGSVLALALYFLLTLLGGAIGLSVANSADARSLGIAAATWASVVTALCLFLGGMVASQLTSGENRGEAAMYGLMVWAVVFGLLLWLMASGVRLGFNAMVGMATTTASVADAAARNTSQADWEDVARRAGFDQSQIDAVKQRVKDAPSQARRAVDDPANRETARETAAQARESTVRATWYTFAGTLVSMLAAVAGGYTGAGPTLRLFPVDRRPTLRA